MPRVDKQRDSATSLIRQSPTLRGSPLTADASRHGSPHSRRSGSLGRNKDLVTPNGTAAPVFEERHHDMIANSFMKSSARFRDGQRFVEQCEKQEMGKLDGTGSRGHNRVVDTSIID